MPTPRVDDSPAMRVSMGAPTGPGPVRAGARASVPPSLAVEIVRPHVDHILEAAATRPLTVVTAGPGWGKTTNVAGWVRRRMDAAAGATAWLTVSRADDNPASFWDSVLTAVRRSGALPAHHPLSHVSTAGGVTDEVLLTLFRGLAALRQPLVLVLDDFHVVSDEDVMSALTDLASHRTPVHLVLLTRVDPPLPLHRLRVSGALSEVSASDLAFDAAAIGPFASVAESLDLSAADVQEVLVRTEGWPTGVRLATMHLARVGPEVGLEGFGGTDRSVAEFLVAEVLDRQDDGMRDFLMRTSVVDIISGSLADSIVPEGGGWARLEVLEQGNQFVACVDRDQGLYRYHPLLRDLLAYSLQRDIPEGYVRAHRAAATWFREQGDPLEGLHHAVAAEDWPLATDIFVDASPELVGVGRMSVYRLLQRIPFDRLPPTPSLELCAAGLEYIPGHFSAMEEHVERARRLTQSGEELRPLALALLNIFAGVATRARGDDAAVATLVTVALDAISRAQPGPVAEGLRSVASTMLAVALLREDKIASARERLRITVRDETRADVPLTILGARGQLAWCDLVEGNLDESAAAAHRVIEDASIRGWTSHMQLRSSYLPLAIAETLWGHWDTADSWTRAGLAADVNGTEAWSSGALHLTQASIAVSNGRVRASVAALNMAHNYLRGSPVSPSLADFLMRVDADVALLIDGSGSGDGLAAGPGLDAVSLTSWSTRARLAFGRGDLEEADAAAQRVAGQPEWGRLDDLLAAIEVSLVKALVADVRGSRRDALTAIGVAVRWPPRNG